MIPSSPVLTQLSRLFRPGKGSRGFSLFELLVVMVIIGFMAALVAPGIGNSLVNLKLKTVTREVSASLRYARSRAVAERKIYLANFDPEKKKMTISQVEAVKKNQGGTDADQSDFRSKVYSFPEGLSLDRAASEGKTQEESVFGIRFFPNGSSSGGTVLLTNERKHRFEISVDFITGLVHVNQQEDSS